MLHILEPEHYDKKKHVRGPVRRKSRKEVRLKRQSASMSVPQAMGPSQNAFLTNGFVALRGLADSETSANGFTAAVLGQSGGVRGRAGRCVLRAVERRRERVDRWRQVLRVVLRQQGRHGRGRIRLPTGGASVCAFSLGAGAGVLAKPWCSRIATGTGADGGP